MTKKRKPRSRLAQAAPFKANPMEAIVRLALRRPFTFVVMAILIAIYGTLAAIRTPVDIFPNIGIPVISPKQIREFNDLPVKVVNGTMVYMRDVAYVHDSAPPQTNVVQLEGKKGVLMTF